METVKENSASKQRELKPLPKTELKDLTARANDNVVLSTITNYQKTLTDNSIVFNQQGETSANDYITYLQELFNQNKLGPMGNVVVEVIPEKKVEPEPKPKQEHIQPFGEVKK